MGSQCGGVCDTCEERNQNEFTSKTVKSSGFRFNEELSENSNQRHLRKRKKLMQDNIKDVPQNASEVHEHNQLSSVAAKILEQRGEYIVGYAEDSVNSGAPILGIFKYDSGETYEGQLLEGLKHGKGKVVWPDGSIYEGHWMNNRRHGKGRVIYALGDSYEGKILFKFFFSFFQFFLGFLRIF